MFLFLLFFFNDTATTEIYTLSLHDALPICLPSRTCGRARPSAPARRDRPRCSPRKRPFHGETLPTTPDASSWRSEEHTSELQSHSDLVCRLLLEKKKKRN